MTKEDAVREITTTVTKLEQGRTLNATLLKFYVTKLVEDICGYCHREDFPPPLVYTAVDLIRKRLADEDATKADEFGGAVRGALSRIKQDDTEFQFAVANVDASGCLSDLDFASVRSKLNLYRKAVLLP